MPEWRLRSCRGRSPRGLAMRCGMRWCRILGAARAAVAQLTVPVIAASAGALMLGEAMSFQFMLATALVLSGVAMAALARG